MKITVPAKEEEEDSRETVGERSKKLNLMYQRSDTTSMIRHSDAIEKDDNEVREKIEVFKSQKGTLWTTSLCKFNNREFAKPFDFRRPAKQFDDDNFDPQMLHLEQACNCFKKTKPKKL
ncbi:hypothetical protein QE152_g25971 [Popillia japonica]|uniref:Uncharacterized protein n=1 Tax=Popillia japonica TaxID=7064 RepID=A0AAW1K083_POPJA